MKKSLIGAALWSLTLSLAGAPSGASECFVVTGASPEKDPKSAFFDERLYWDYTSYAGMHCSVLEHWDQLDQILINSSEIEAGTQILIIQGAHGGPGGSASCDAGRVSGDQILRSLQNYTKKYQITAMINSCFSGDLMRKKIETDERERNISEIKNFCLVTSSYFGRTSSGSAISDFLKIAKRGDSIEDLISRSTFDGMISSSAWSESGVAAYFLSGESALGYQALDHMRTIITSHLPTHKLYVPYAEHAITTLDLCLDPRVTDSHFQLFTEFLEHAYISISDIEVQIEQNEWNIHHTMKECLKAYNEHLTDFIQKQHESNVYFQVLKDSLEEFKTSDAFDPCKGISFKGKYFSGAKYLLRKIKDAEKRVSEVFAKRALRNLPPIQLSSRSSSPSCSSSSGSTSGASFQVPEKNTRKLESIFGSSFFKEELDKDDDPMCRPDKKFSAEKILREFTRASLWMDHSSNEIDAARRDACRSFKILPSVRKVRKTKEHKEKLRRRFKTIRKSL